MPHLNQNEVQIKIKPWRNERNISLNTLSELSGIGSQVLESYECNSCCPSINELYKISLVLKVDLYELFDMPGEY